MSGLIKYLNTDPEIISLRNRFKEVTGEWYPYHWEEFGSTENYKKYMQGEDYMYYTEMFEVVEKSQ